MPSVRKVSPVCGYSIEPEAHRSGEHQSDRQLARGGAVPPWLPSEGRQQGLGSSRRNRAALLQKMSAFCASVRNGASSIAAMDIPMASGHTI
jgi:hypothetical protein